MDYKENKKGITNTTKDQKENSINLEEKREESPNKKMVAVLQKKALDFTERPDWLNKLINLSEEIYYLTYLDKKNKNGKKLFTENYFRNEWPNSLYGLAGKKIPIDLLIQLCENGTIKDPSKPFTEEELGGELGKIKAGEENIKDLCKKQKEEVIVTLAGIKSSISHNKSEKLHLDDTRIGKLIYQDYFKIAGRVNIILNHLAYPATRIKGYDAFASFNKREKSFFIQSKDLVALKRLFEELNEKFPGCANLVEDAMIHGKIVEGLTEEIFLNTIDPQILVDAKKISEKQSEKTMPEKESEPESIEDETEINDDNLEPNASETPEVLNLAKPNEDKVVDEKTEGKSSPKELVGDIRKEILVEKETIPTEPKKEDIVKIDQKDTKQNSETKIEGKGKQKENLEKMISVLEAEKKLDEARENYINEYKKCKKEAQKQTLIDKTRNAAFNILAGIKNLTRKEKIKYHKEVIKPENYLTKEAIEAKDAYTKAKIEMGNEMFNQKKIKFEKAGLTGDELRQALEQYKAVEILGKTIIDERQKVIEAKAEKPALLKRLLDSYLKIKPKWKRVALSTLVFLPLAASGALGASAIAAGGIYGGIAGLAVVKFSASMAIGGAVGHLSKGIDWAKKGSDIKFAQNQYDKKIELQEKFSNGGVSPEEYEKEIDNLEEAEKKRNRNILLLKVVAGGALAIIAGYVAYDALGNGLDNLAGSDNNINTLEATGSSEINKVITDLDDNIKHVSVEATANNGQGAISTIHELQENLKLEYKDSLENAPVSVKHILETDAHKLAQEFGMYKPGQDAESLLIKSGSSFKVDGSGNLSFHDVDTNSDVSLLKATEIKIENPIEGKMVDSDHSGVNGSNENTINTDETSDVNQTQVEPKVIDLNNPNAVTVGQVAPRVIDLNKTNIDSITRITPKTVDLNNLDTGVKPDGLNTEILAPTAVKELSQDYIHRLFPTEKMMSNWHYVDKNISAQRLIELSNKGEINPSFESLGHHIKNLSDLSGLKPDGGIPGIIPAEKISDFTERAYEKINELGKIDEIKVYDNSNIENAVTNIKKTNLEEIIKSTKGVHEVNIDHLKDLKEITKGYEGLPGQPPIKMIMENVSGKGLHSIVSEDVAETKAAAMMSSNFKMNNIMSTVGGKTYHDYYFDKVLPNGNIKLIHIKFYK